MLRGLSSAAIAKEWLGIKPDDTAVDGLLDRLIRAASSFVLNFLNRDTLLLKEYVETYDTYGGSYMMLRNSPVLDIAALSFMGVPQNQSTGDGFTSPRQNGWALEPEYSVNGAQRINFYGTCTPRGRATCMVRYRAGYVVPKEDHTVPSAPDGSGNYLVTPNEFWLGDVGVTLADGTALTPAIGAPGPGEYAVSADGVYSFNADLAGEGVLITYSFVPPDIVQVTTELVGERYKYMDRIGVVSKALGGQETVSFSQAAMSAFSRELLVPYKRVVPI